MGRHRITADEARMATRGDLAEEDAQDALGKLWEVFLAHAAEAWVGEGKAWEENVDETPNGKERDAPGRGEENRTLYEGEDDGGGGRGSGGEVSRDLEGKRSGCPNDLVQNARGRGGRRRADGAHPNVVASPQKSSSSSSTSNPMASDARRTGGRRGPRVRRCGNEGRSSAMRSPNANAPKL